jgi:molybdopterin converting factor small subunit
LAQLRLFAAAREAAGTPVATIDAATVGDLLDVARASFGEHFAAVLDASRVWLNGEPTTDDAAVGARDTVAVLPPVSGG